MRFGEGEPVDDHDPGGRVHDFFMASGTLQVLMYKHELEKHLRTDNYAGFQLLCLNDYSGQGSALVGVTDVFFNAKEYISADEWRRFCNTTVPLRLSRPAQGNPQKKERLTANI